MQPAEHRHTPCSAALLGAALIFAACHSALAADPPTAPAPLRMRAGAVQVADVGASDAGDAVVLRLRGPLTRAVRRQIVDEGVELLGYLPPNAYLARLAPGTLARVRALPAVVQVGAYDPAWRICPRLLALKAVMAGGVTAPTSGPAEYLARVGRRRALLAEAGVVQVAIAAQPGVDVDGLAARIAGLAGCRVRNTAAAGALGFIDAEIPLTALEALAGLDGVQFIEDAPVGSERNATTAPFLQSGGAATPYWDLALQGEGQIVGVIDTPPDAAHCMFSDSVAIGAAHRKLVYGDPNPLPSYGSHGTFVAGVLAGDEGVWGTCTPGDGLACAARIAWTDVAIIYATPAELYPALQAAHDAGAWIHTNSWGDDGTTAYTTWCSQIDAFSYDHEFDAVIFAVSNYAALHTPENAKNVLAVGASWQFPYQDTHCYGGAGPTADGRRKPEVFAPGCGVYSASAGTGCATRTGSGTSYAAPAIAAGMALVRQYFVEGFYPNGERGSGPSLTPTGALLRAMMINAATDMTDSPGYPSDAEGWGAAGLHRVLYLAGAPIAAAGHRRLVVRDIPNGTGLATGELHRMTVGVWSAEEPLRVTLVFTDPPALVGAADPVVNDLDLRVRAPDRAEYLGNAFVDGVSAPGGSPDDRNTVEQVLFAAPAPGIYTIEIAATAVNGPAEQGFAVVVTGDVLAVTEGLPEFPNSGPPNRGALPTAFGDADLDNDCDLRDFAVFQACYGGPAASYAEPACAVFDIDVDGDIDAADYAGLLYAQTAPLAE